MTKDPSGIEANSYRYAGANPINQIDPAGLVSIAVSGLSGPAAFAACFDIHTGAQGTTIYYSAQVAVWICKMAYSQDSWSVYKGSFALSKLRPTTAHELMGRFVYENSANDFVFDGTEPLTQELAVSSLAQIVKNKYYREGETPTYKYYEFHASTSDSSHS